MTAPAVPGPAPAPAGEAAAALRVEDLEAGAARAGLSAGEGLAQDALGEALLAVHHELDDDLVRCA